jgi:hypothetical protein
MKKTKLITDIGHALTKTKLKAQKHSPEILIAVGVVGTITSVVLACRATTKLPDVMEKTKEHLDEIHMNTDLELMTVEASKKEIALTYAETGLEIVKIYGPSVIIGTLSLTSIIASNNILRKRNAALAAAYMTIDKSFKEYKERVADRFGEEVEKEIRYDIKTEQVEEKITNEKGKTKTVTKDVKVMDPNLFSEYARYFDKNCSDWNNDANYNFTFLRAQQAHANDKLKANGILFLNEVYEMIGLPPTKEGQIVGWVYEKGNEDGDNFVDFGIYQGLKAKAEGLVDEGYDPVILLDFNVDGNVWAKM